LSGHAAVIANRAAQFAPVVGTQSLIRSICNEGSNDETLISPISLFDAYYGLSRATLTDSESAIKGDNAFDPWFTVYHIPHGYYRIEW